MATGIELLLAAALCAACPPPNGSLPANLILLGEDGGPTTELPIDVDTTDAGVDEDIGEETLETIISKKPKLHEMREWIGGKHLRIATLEDFPLSYTELLENGTRIGHGVSFQIIDFLKKKFNFTYEVFVPQENIIGSPKDFDRSLIEMVNSNSTRLLFATWWIFITILTSFYTANLTAFLTLSKFTLPYNTVNDILAKNKHFVSMRGGGVEYAIRTTNESLSMLNRMIQNNYAVFSDETNDTYNLLNYVESNGYVFVRDRPAINIMLYQDYLYRKSISFSDEKVHCPFAMAKEPFLKKKRTFAYPIGSNLSQLFDPDGRATESDGAQWSVVAPSRWLRGWRRLDSGHGQLLGASTHNQNVTPPPPYQSIFNGGSHGDGDPLNRWRRPLGHGNAIGTGVLLGGDSESGVRRLINGRDYLVFRTPNGQSQLVPVRSPSAALFQYSYTE
uniref:Uncharacterized protein LOC108038316 n=1 Tax=Drosophila rhopaloa TaxID=1041015 RepID=A0A6P4DYF6_DRORH